MDKNLAQQYGYEPPISLLLMAGDVRKDKGWRNYQEDYGFSETDIPELVRMILDDNLYWAMSDKIEVWSPIHAWRALAQMNAQEVIPPMLKRLNEQDDEEENNFDDWIGSEIIAVSSKLGPPILPKLKGFLENPRHNKWGRAEIGECIERIGQQYPESRDECVAILMEQLKKFSRQKKHLNGTLISNLAALQAVEAADLIEKAFAVNRVDLAIGGDWEEIQIQLGLLEKRITPPPKHGWLDFQLRQEAKEKNPKAQSDDRPFGWTAAEITSQKRSKPVKRLKGGKKKSKKRR